MRRSIMAGLCAILLAGAAQAQNDAHPIRKRPLTAREIAAIKAILDEKLLDPASAQYQFYPMSDAAIYCGRVNAKNRYGGYDGFRVFIVTLMTTPLAIDITSAFIIADQRDTYGNMSEDAIKWRLMCVNGGYPIYGAP